MANLLDMIEVQRQKGFDLINKNGDFTTREKVVKMAKMDYMKGLKDGSIPFETIYSDYELSVLGDYTYSVELLESIKNKLDEEPINTEDTDVNPPKGNGRDRGRTGG